MLKLKEGVDYHIKEVGKSLELQSISLAGFTAGIIELTRRSYDINLATTRNMGMLLMLKTIPKTPKPQKAPKKKPEPKVVKEKSPAKGVVKAPAGKVK